MIGRVPPSPTLLRRVPPRPAPQRRGMPVRRALLLTLLAAVLAGCGLRLDSPPPAVPEAGATEELRQAAARGSAGLAERAGAVAGEDGPGAEVAATVEESSRAHVRALGGVWEPWPGAGPEATAHPGEAPTSAGHVAPTPGGDAHDLLAALDAAADEAREQAGSGPPELAALLGAVAVNRQWAALDLAAALEEPAAGPAPTPETDELAALLDGETRKRLDGARYAMEVVAARSAGGQREAAGDRAADLRSLVADAPVGEQSGEAAYDVQHLLQDPPAGQTPERALAAQAELDVLGTWIGLMASEAPAAAGRGVLLVAARDAADRARSWGAPVPVLPGLEPPG